MLMAGCVRAGSTCHSRQKLSCSASATAWRRVCTRARALCAAGPPVPEHAPALQARTRQDAPHTRPRPGTPCLQTHHTTAARTSPHYILRSKVHRISRHSQSDCYMGMPGRRSGMQAYSAEHWRHDMYVSRAAACAHACWSTAARPPRSSAGARHRCHCSQPAGPAWFTASPSCQHSGARARARPPGGTLQRAARGRARLQLLHRVSERLQEGAPDREGCRGRQQR